LKKIFKSKIKTEKPHVCSLYIKKPTVNKNNKSEGEDVDLNDLFAI